jgi:hypothetical protein
MNKTIYLMGLCCAGPLGAAVAAPMDAFLTANHNNVVGAVEFEAAYDLVNSTVDVFNIRAKDADFAGTNVGDYHGAHVRAGVAITPRLWLDGGFWERKIDYRDDAVKVKSWQLAAQYKLLNGVAGYRPSIALRAGAWGNYSNELNKSSPTAVRGQTLDTITVDSPKDNQFQLDLIGTTMIFDHTELSMFVGAGTSRVSVGDVSATAKLDGCPYNLAFGATKVVATQASACAGQIDGRVEAFNSVYGIDVNSETQYRANFVHGGLMLNWEKSAWQLRGGYQYQYLKRKQIDDTINSRGGSSYQSNHTLVGEVKYQLIPEAAVFLRGQYMTNQFVGEIPFAYNSLTASRFGKRYGILSAGVLMTF